MFSQNDWGRSKLQAGKYWQLGLSPWLHEVVHWGWTGGQAGQQALIHLAPWRWSWQSSWPLAAGWVAWAIGLPPNGSKWAMTTHSGWGPSMDHLCALPWEAAHLAGNHGWWPSEKLWCGWWTSWGNLSMDMNKWKQWKHGMPANCLWFWRLTKKHKPYSCHGNQRTLRTCHGCHGTIGLLDEVLIGHQLLRPLGRVWWDLYGHGFSKEGIAFSYQWPSSSGLCPTCPTMKAFGWPCCGGGTKLGLVWPQSGRPNLASWECGQPGPPFGSLAIWMPIDCLWLSHSLGQPHSWRWASVLSQCNFAGANAWWWIPGAIVCDSGLQEAKFKCFKVGFIMMQCHQAAKQWWNATNWHTASDSNCNSFFYSHCLWCFATSMAASLWELMPSSGKASLSSKYLGALARAQTLAPAGSLPMASPHLIWLASAPASSTQW